MMPSKNETLRERWDILRAHGVPSSLCRDARTSSKKFSDALTLAGGDPSKYPHLLNSFHGARRRYSMARDAVQQRERRAQLKAAGLDWIRTDAWARSASGTQYALRRLAAGLPVPESPGVLRKAARKVAEAAAAVAVVLFLCVNGWGCGWPNDPPDFYVIDSEFPEPQREVIRASFDAWCDAEGYCPTEQLWADRGRVMLVDDLPEDGRTMRNCPEGRTCQTSGHNKGGDNIEIARERARADDLSALWVVVCHEIGHYCTDHTKTGLMAAAHDEPVVEIDETARRAWRAGCP